MKKGEEQTPLLYGRMPTSKCDRKEETEERPRCAIPKVVTGASKACLGMRKALGERLAGWCRRSTCVL